LQRAATHLFEAIPGIEIEAYFVDFEGIWDAEVTTDSRESQSQAIA
jgi:hypothetical protein